MAKKKKTKLEKIEGPMDLDIDEMEEFWSKAVDFLYHGQPSRDKKGHSTRLQVRVRPVQMDILERIKELFPKDWFRNTSELLRGLLTLGGHSALFIHKMKFQRGHKEIESIAEILSILNAINREDRINELKTEIGRTKQKLKDKPEGADIISILEKFEKKIA